MFKHASRREYLEIVFWTFCYLLSWHLNIQIVLHCCWHVLFLSPFHAHMFYLSRWAYLCAVLPSASCLDSGAGKSWGTPYLIAVRVFALCVQGEVFLQLRAALAQAEMNWNEPNIFLYVEEQSQPQISFLYFSQVCWERQVQWGELLGSCHAIHFCLPLFVFYFSVFLKTHYCS